MRDSPRKRWVRLPRRFRIRRTRGGSFRPSAFSVFVAVDGEHSGELASLPRSDLVHCLAFAPFWSLSVMRLTPIAADRLLVSAEVLETMKTLGRDSTTVGPSSETRKRHTSFRKQVLRCLQRHSSPSAVSIIGRQIRANRGREWVRGRRQCDTDRVSFAKPVPCLIADKISALGFRRK